MPELNSHFMSEMENFTSEGFRFIVTGTGVFTETIDSGITHLQLAILNNIPTNTIIDAGRVYISRWKNDNYIIIITGDSETLGYPGGRKERESTLSLFKQNYPDAEVRLE